MSCTSNRLGHRVPGRPPPSSPGARDPGAASATAMPSTSGSPGGTSRPETPVLHGVAAADDVGEHHRGAGAHRLQRRVGAALEPRRRARRRRAGRAPPPAPARAGMRWKRSPSPAGVDGRLHRRLELAAPDQHEPCAAGTSRRHRGASGDEVLRCLLGDQAGDGADERGIAGQAEVRPQVERRRRGFQLDAVRDHDDLPGGRRAAAGSARSASLARRPRTRSVRDRSRRSTRTPAGTG